MAKNEISRWDTARRMAAVLMAFASVALIALSGWWYTTTRQPFLTAHPTTIAQGHTVPLPVEPTDRDAYGIRSAERVLDRKGQTAGYVLVVERTGYKSTIRMRCRYTADGSTLADLRIVSQDETEYLGSRITAASFLDAFSGRLLPVKLWTGVTPGSPVDGLSGSTVSAQAVVDGVNQGYRFLRKYAAG